VVLTSPANPRVKAVVRLRQRSHRDELGLMIVEGYRELKRAVDNGHFPSDLFVCESLFQGSNEPTLIERCVQAGAHVLRCTPAVFAKMAYRDRPEGLLAVAPQVRRGLDSLAPPSDALVVVAEAIEKPGNLGTILRSADAAGACAALVCDRCTDVNNPNVVRASIGALFSLPVVETTTDDAMKWLGERRFRIVATSPHAQQVYSDADLTGNVAIVVGTEQYGLTDRWMESAAVKVRIPMRGQSDSLNVAAATTILLFEAARQRDARAGVHRP
jgi:TrmH family RNA methyltransferase